jgi:hypothetical protein
LIGAGVYHANAGILARIYRAGGFGTTDHGHTNRQCKKGLSVDGFHAFYLSLRLVQGITNVFTGML